MGWTNWVCWPCSASKSEETQVLIAPGRLRGQSIISHQDGYGTMPMSTDDNGGLQPGSVSASPPRVSDEQRARMSEISRTAGSHMRPISSYFVRGARVRSPSPCSVSNSPSRESSPSPPRPLSSPPGGVIGGKPRTISDASHDSSISYMTRSTSSGTNDGQGQDGADGVVRKSIFGDNGNGFTADRRTTSGGSRRASGGRRRKRQS